MPRALAWSCWTPLVTLVAVEIYASGYDGWGAWATAPLFLLPLGLSLTLVVVGIAQCVREARSRGPRPATIVLILVAALPLVWLVVRRYVS